MHAGYYECGEFRVDTANRRFMHADREIALEPRVFAVIVQLLARPGALLARNELLDAVWGHRYVTPSTLNRTIALARRAFGDERAEPRYIQTVHGAGYRYIGPISPPPDGAAPASIAFGPPPLAQLPERIDSLIGREGALTTLADMIAGHRAVTVIAPGGMGKTQCALEAARRAAPDFPDGVWFFDLVAVERAEDWLRTLGAALAVRTAVPEILLGRTGTLLRERRVLLVLDNCERVSARLGEMLFELLRSTGALKVLTTSQVALNFSGEQLMRLPPLSLPPDPTTGACDEQAIAASPAVDLLVKRIHAVQPEFRLTSANAATIAQICVRLDGMPLALEFAAARFLLLSAEQVLQHLEERFRFLATSAAGHEPRHRSLQALLDWSYGLLSRHEARLLNWCAVFVQTWSIESTVGLAASLGHDPERTIDLLTSLVNHSLITVVPGVSPPRYRLLETVRDYALAQLRVTGEETAARHAHMQVMLAMCRAAHADMLGGRMRERIEQLTRDRGNIGVAIDTSLRTSGDHDEALEILGSLLLYAKGRGDHVAVARWCEAAFAACADMRAPYYSRALLTYGFLQVHFSSAGKSLGQSVLPEAARLAAAQQDWWAESYAHAYHAMGLASLAELEQAEMHATLAEVHAAGHSDPILRGLTGLARGWIGLARGDASGALDCLLPVQDLGADLHQRHFIDVYIALSYFTVGEHVEAARYWLRAMELAAAVGHIRGVAGSIEGCGYLLCSAGNWGDATRMLAAAQLIREQTEMPIFGFWLPHQRAVLAVLRARLAAAEFAAETERGMRTRPEDAAREAQAFLWRLAGNAEQRSAQRMTNRPSGS